MLIFLTISRNKVVGAVVLVALGAAVATRLETAQALSANANSVTNSEVGYALPNSGDLAYNLMSDNNWVGCRTPVAA